MARITSLDLTDVGHIRLTTEDGESISAPIIASDVTYFILNHDRGDKWVALQVVNYGADGGDELLEGHQEGDTFADEFGDRFVVRRTDNAGSLKWVPEGS